MGNLFSKENKAAFINPLNLDNPVVVQVLGICSALAVTSQLEPAIVMGLSVTVITAFANVIISLLRNAIPDNVRIPCYIVIIAGFVTIVQMLVHAFFPELYEMLGVYLALITVNCIILGRAEMFASKNTVLSSALDGLGMGLGFTLALCAIAAIREVFGAASFAGMPIAFLENYKIEFLVKAPGGMLVYGLLIALVALISRGKAPLKKEFSCAGCPSAEHCHSGMCENKKEAK